MNLNIFQISEIAQAIDPSTSIWEKVKIVGRRSDWSLKVKWVDWNQYPLELIEVPIENRAFQNSWNIRKAQYNENSDPPIDPDSDRRDSLRTSTRNAAVTVHNQEIRYTNNPRILSHGREVFFWDYESQLTKKGTVVINDPFNRTLTVQQDDILDETIIICYSALRGGDSTVMPIPEDESSMGSEPDPNLPSTSTCIPNRKTKLSNKEIEMVSLVECEQIDVPVALTYVPCVNGILKFGSVANCAGEDFTVNQLEFIGSRKKAMALLKSVTDEDFTIRMPALNVMLKDGPIAERYLRSEVSTFSIHFCQKWDN